MNLRFSVDRLGHFFTLLPRDTEAAPTLAEHRSEWLADRAWAKTRRRRELRRAIESRHQSFLDPAFVALMRKHRVALVFADSVAWPHAEDVTADFVYLRCMVPGSFMPAALGRCAQPIYRAYQALGRGAPTNDASRAAADIDPPVRVPRDVYACFDTDAKVRAPVEARSLRARVARLPS